MINIKEQYRGYILFLFILIIAFLLGTPSKAALTIENKRECTTCHITWLEEFKREYETPLISFDETINKNSGKHDASSTERMCFSCHDGFVLDSRFMWQNKRHSHPVGVKPTDEMQIPTANGKITYPLDDEGKVYCGTCHTAHGVDWASNTSAIFMREENINSSMCMSCHVDKHTEPVNRNHPIAAKLANKPEKLIAAGAKLGTDGSVICESCHRPHGGEQDSMLVMTNTESKLCVSCHTEKGLLIGSSHDLSLESKQTGTNDTNKGPCSACHVTHNSKNRSLLSLTVDKGKSASFCLSCHRKGGSAENMTTGSHSHPIGMALDKANSLTLPLYNSSGQLDETKDGLVKCLTCHDPHGLASHSKKQNKIQPDKISKIDNFLRIEQESGSKLCVSCHADKGKIVNSPHDLDTKEANNEVCKQCHSVHNANGVSLKKPLNQPRNMSIIEGWCKDCHKEGGLAEKTKISGHNHPLGVVQEKLNSNVSLPLFDQLGKKVSGTGMVDCATCHDPHQWAAEPNKKGNTKKINKDGDASNSFLRITANHSSKLCVTCHQTNGLVIGTDHDMVITAPESVNIQGNNAYQSGSCGQCHLVHTKNNEPNLWAQKAVEALDINEQQCLSCHRSNGVAKQKVPLRINHPHDIMVWSERSQKDFIKGNKPDVPVFNKKGEDHHAGFITCLSCHNPHQWDPAKAVAGNGLNREGDVMNSFLRNSNSQYIICADCHGKDALYRYKYFHGERAHQKEPEE